jgi:dihydrofolate reductase
MGRIVITEFVSLDGVIEAPGGGEGFRHDGWSFEIDRGDEGNAFKLEETMASEALLLGRKTYEGFAAAWPDRDGEFADKFNTMPKYVSANVAKLKEAHEGDVVVHGSAMLTQALLENDLVDAMHLMVFPVVLGEGKRLFGHTSDKKRLRLAGSKTVGDGVLILTYEREV